jgi:hypothetical protein
MCRQLRRLELREPLNQIVPDKAALQCRKHEKDSRERQTKRKPAMAEQVSH